MSNATKFNGTVEFLGKGSAIVELHDLNGVWSGIGRITVPGMSRSSLYELAYRDASVRAAHKGGQLETFKVLG